MIIVIGIIIIIIIIIIITIITIIIIIIELNVRNPNPSFVLDPTNTAHITPYETYFLKYVGRIMFWC